jgi:hypothetical protein
MLTAADLDSDRVACKPAGVDSAGATPRESRRKTLELELQTRDTGAGARGRRSGLLGLGEALAGVALRPVVAGVEIGRRAERELRGAVVSGVDAATLAAVDTLLASPLAGEVVDRVLASPLARMTVERALSGPLVEAASRNVVQYAVLERVADELLPGETVDGLLERAQTADVPRRVADRLLADGVLDQTVARVLEGPELERVVESALDSAAMEKLVVRVIESRLLEEAVERLLQTDELWLMVDEIARSPAVAEAIQRQSLGFADEVAGGVRTRSRKVDDRLETSARRIFRRKPREAPGSGA